MRILLVDNHGPYTINLCRLIATVVGSTPTILTNDDKHWDHIDTNTFDALIISPGPGHPQNPHDLGHTLNLLNHTHLPVLGLGLGHLTIAHLAGAHVDLAPTPRYGHLSHIHHTDHSLFTGLPQHFTAVRHHSLAVHEPLPTTLRATAWAEDNVVMGLEHRNLPRWGLQFHPESVAGEHGTALLTAFCDHIRPRATTPPAASHTTPPPTNPTPTQTVRTLTLPQAIDTEAAFAHLYGNAEHAFWLDSSRPEGPARFSFLGAPTGEILTYRHTERTVHVHHANGTQSQEPGTIFEALDQRLPDPIHSDLPFDFTGGYVGYFGYELKADCGARPHHTATTPDAVWMRCDRFVAVDHHQDRTYLVCTDPGPNTNTWLERTRAALTELKPLPDPPAAAAPLDLAPHLERPHQDYIVDIKECLNHLAQGHSYEICLTNRVRLPDDHSNDLDFYRRMRAASPAPYAALLRLGRLTVLSASPERFLRVDTHRTAESRPIKGTAARLPDPQADARAAQELRTGAKTRAENLLVVDLLRNDLGRVCQAGSIEVPAFMYTETHATVHQLISTVRGLLRPEVSTLEAIRACFPSGSMTGVPKLETMEIIDRLESTARGVYSGALGYLSRSGACDLSVVIRTAVRADGELTIGAGGAIVLASDPHQEYQEMLLKAAVPAQGR